MSDNIPFDLQIEIIKKVFDVKSLVRFRSVSKPWKSFIDSSQFIKGHGARHTQPHSHIISLPSISKDYRFICLVDDDNNESFKVQEQEFAPFVLSPLLKRYDVYNVIGACHGLLCLRGYHYGYDKRMLVIWNPSIGKSFGIATPIDDYSLIPRPLYGFGVCPVNKDPTVVKIIQIIGMPWHVEVFTLSSGVWNVIPSGNLLPQSIQLDAQAQVVIDRFIYWSAREETITHDGYYTTSNNRVVSFDLITKEFNLVDLPDSLTNELYGCVSVSKLRECLVVYGNIKAVGVPCCGVWVMERDSSFRKLFSIGTPYYSYYMILGFSKNGEPILEIRKVGGQFITINVYDPSSQQPKNLRISGGEDGSSFMGSYQESLLLLDHSDSRIYWYNN